MLVIPLLVEYSENDDTGCAFGAIALIGATVTGDFSGTFNEPSVSSPLTDASGSTVLETTSAQKGNISVTFCVTAITHAVLANWSGNACTSN